MVSTNTKVIGVEVGAAYLGTLLLARILFQLKHINFISSIMHGVIAVAFLYIPVWLIRRRGLSLEAYGLTMGNLKRDLKWLALLVGIVFPVFAGGYHYYQKIFFDNSISFNLPENFATLCVFHIVVVAFPEEVFYRGYLQGRLEELIPPKFSFLYARVGLGWLFASFLFAVGHLLVDGRFQRLGVFFPALLFGLMRKWTGTVVLPALFHGLCNIFMAVLEKSYFG